MVFIFRAFSIFLCSSVFLLELILLLAGRNGSVGFFTSRNPLYVLFSWMLSHLSGFFQKFQLGGPGDSLEGWEHHQVVNITRSDFPMEPTAWAPVTLCSCEPVSRTRFGVADMRRSGIKPSFPDPRATVHPVVGCSPPSWPSCVWAGELFC